MTLAERLSQDLAGAMKARDAARVSVLRMARAALQNREIEKRAALEEPEVMRVLRVLVKQREEAVEQYRRAHREDLAGKEEAEIAVLQSYLPAEASPAEIEAAVETAVAATGAASLRDMGAVMKAALGALQASGRPADGKKVNEAVRRRLGG